MGPSGVILVQQRSAAGGFREPKRRGVIAVFEGEKDRRALGRRGKFDRKKKVLTDTFVGVEYLLRLLYSLRQIKTKTMEGVLSKCGNIKHYS